MRRRGNSEYIERLDSYLQQLFSLSFLPSDCIRHIQQLKDVLLVGGILKIGPEGFSGLGVDEEGKQGAFDLNSAREISSDEYRNYLRQALWAREYFENDPPTFGDDPFEVPELEQWRLDHINTFGDEP